MLGRLSAWLLPVFGLLLPALPAHAQNAPLPPNALTRLNCGTNAVLCLAFSADGKTLATGGYEKTIQIWDPIQGTEIRHWQAPEGNISALTFSPDGRHLASGALDDVFVHLWDWRNGRHVRDFAGLPKGTSSLAFTPDGGQLAAGGYRTGSVLLWDVKSGKETAELSRAGWFEPSQPAPEFSYTAFSADGKLLASGHRQGLIRIWDASKRKEIRYFQGPQEDSFVHLAFSPDAQILASWSGTIRLWRTDRWTWYQFFADQPALVVAAVSFSPDGKMLASGSSGRETGDNLVHVWEVATGQERLRLPGHEYAISSLLFSPDGAVLVSGSRDGTALIWDMRKPMPAGPLTPDELHQCWEDLASNDAALAYRAIRMLVTNRAQAVAYFKEKLRPVPRLTASQIGMAVADLDSPSFFERQRAADLLSMQAELIETDLKNALRARPSPQVRRALERILDLNDKYQLSPRQLQILRAIEVLEQAGGDQTRQVLQSLAASAPGSRITREAKTSLERLAKRF
jgi:WD40 repeat protein